MDSSDESQDGARPGRSRAWLAGAAAWVFALAVWGHFLSTGLAGIDFGDHWDEQHQIRAVETALKEETLLPRWYNYPSHSFWLTFGSLAPEILPNLPSRKVELEQLTRDLRETARSSEFRLRVRRVFLWGGSLLILWAFVAGRALRGRWLEGAASAALLAGSFEYAYHSRWIAPDMIVATWSAAVLACLAISERRPPDERRAQRGLWWRVAAAVCAGLATSTKYNAALLLVPILVAQLSAPRVGLGRRLRIAVGLGLTSFLVYLLITPGTFLQPFEFFRDLRFELAHYKRGHYGFTVGAGSEHLLLAARYISLDLFSPWNLLGATASLLALGGWVSLLRTRARLALMLLSFPLAYVASMVSYRVFFARNLLILGPWFAVFAGVGLGSLFERLKDPWRRALPVAFLILWSVVHGVFLSRAAASIQNVNPRALMNEVLSYLEAHPDRPTYASEYIKRSFQAFDLKLPEHVTLDKEGPAEWALVIPDDIAAWGVRPANRPGTVEHIFGPQDIHFEYYASWNTPRIMIYERGILEDFGLWPPMGAEMALDELDFIKGARERSRKK